MTLINKVDQFKADADLAHQIVNGDATTVVMTEGGPVRSMAKLIADAELESQRAIEEFENAGGVLTTAAEAAKDAAQQAQAQTESARDDAVAVVYSGDASLEPAAGKIPVARADGTIDPAWLGDVAAAILGSGVSQINYIGTPGKVGFGVGICPTTPPGYTPLPGTFVLGSDEYGNYQYSDGSIMCWIPAFYYKWGTGTNGLTLNDVDVKPFSAFPDVATANAAGYALHRAFYDGGAIKQGVFVDKYQCSNNGGIASSIKLGNPLSSGAANNPYSGLTGAPANSLGGSVAAAKTRGADFFCNSRFIFAALALLSYAHGRASSSTTFCAWYNATNNFPKGNNNALRDVNDTEVLYIGTGYLNAGKTGSANLFARTTHNGQNSGIADLNGNIWEFTPGLTSNGTNLYILNTSVRMKDVTGGNTLATDLFGATGIAAMYTDLGTTYEALWATGVNRTVNYGNATNQVFSAATTGTAWNYAGLGGPLAAGVGGTNAFGNDALTDQKPNEMAPFSSGAWDNSSGAGVWALVPDVRTSSRFNVGFRSALYL